MSAVELLEQRQLLAGGVESAGGEGWLALDGAGGSQAVEALPDLQCPSSKLAAGTATEGSAFWVQECIYNRGPGDAGPSYARLYLSTDNDLDVSDDWDVGEQAVGALASGGAAYPRWYFDMPSLGSGTYSVWVVCVADSRGEVVESDESNTYKTYAGITVSTPVNTAPVIAGIPDQTLDEDTTLPAGLGQIPAGTGDGLVPLGFGGDLIPAADSAESGSRFRTFDQFGGTWFDAEKDTQPGDDLMCWAAAASNALQWSGYGLVGGMSNSDQIFQYFQDHWTDAGGLPMYGWDWWFDGTNPKQGGPGWSQVDVEGGGFFPGLVPSDHIFSRGQGDSANANAMADIDAYCRAGYGVAIGLFGSIGHAVTCWGFNYDPALPASDRAYYKGIWITDSDDNKTTAEGMTAPDILHYYAVTWDGANGRWDFGAYYPGSYIGEVDGLERQSFDPLDLWQYASDAETRDSGLSFSIVGNTDPNCGVSIESNRFIRIRPADNWYGVSDVTVQVSDGKLTATDTFRITVNPVNDAPTIGSVSDGPDPVVAGQDVVLTAGGVGDVDGTVPSVSFYRESNGIAGLQVGSGGDMLLGSVSGGPYSLSVATSGLPAGSYTYYAQAVDEAGALSGVVSTTNTVVKIPAISVADVSVSEGDSGTGAVTISGTLSSASEQTITVQYATADGTATLADHDYAASSGIITIPAGATTWSISLPLVIGDYRMEPEESFYVDLSNPTNAIIGRSRGTVTIANDDVAGSVQFSSATYSANENGGAVTITMTRSGGNASGTFVSYGTSNGTAQAGQDYTATSGTLTFAGGEASRTFTVPIVDDALVEGSEIFNLSLSALDGASLGSPNTAVVTILDDDTAVVSQKFDFGTVSSPVETGYTQVTHGTKYSANLGYGWLSGTIQSRDRGTGTALTRDFDFTPDGTFVVDVPNGSYDVVLMMGDATNAHDQMGVYLEGVLMGSVSTAANQFKTVTYATMVSDGQLTLRLKDLGGTDPNVVINALEVRRGVPAISIADVSVGEGDSGVQSVTISGALSWASTQTVTVQYATADGTATVADNDYAAGNGTITINPGETTWSISLPLIQGDSRLELDEYFYIDLSNPSNAVISRSRASVTITNDDAAGLLRGFDFGTVSSPVETGYAQVTHGTKYSAALGYGWLSGTIQSRDRGTGTALTRDFDFTADGTFVVDVPNGSYGVVLTLGDATYGHDQMGVYLEGVLMGTVSTAANQFKTVMYQTTVSDGQLTLHLRDLGGADPNVVINAMQVTAVGGLGSTSGVARDQAAKESARAEPARTAGLFSAGESAGEVWLEPQSARNDLFCASPIEAS